MKNSTILSIIFLVLSSTGCAHGGNIGTKLDSYVAAFAEQEKFSGSVLVASDGEVLLNKGYGMANYELDVPNTSLTKFRVASITKQFTAMAIMKLQEKELLSVDDKLSKYIPDYPNADKITIHHLLTHRSGIPNPCRSSSFKEEKIKPHTLEQLIELFKNEPLDFQPAEQMKYSNSNYILLTYIIEKASGEKYDSFLKENIFDRIDMKNSGIDRADKILKGRASGYRFKGNELVNADYMDMTFVSGAGVLYSTVEDLYKWDQALYTEKLVSKNSLTSIFAPYYAQETGYGWWIYKLHDRNVVSHDGGIDGFSGTIHRYPDDKICIIILGNREEINRQGMAKGLAAIVLGEGYQLPIKRFEITIDPALYDQYVGNYRFDDEAIMHIFKARDRLFAQVAGRNLELLPETESQFFHMMTEVRISFLKDEYGTVTGLMLRDPLDKLARKLD